MSEENNNTLEKEKPVEKTTVKKTTTKKTAKKETANNKVNKDYPRKPDGSVDWFKVIPEEFIVPQAKEKKGTPISELEDHEKMVLLGGWKYLLKERGYISKRDFVHVTNNEFAAITCQIVWAPHEDSGNISQTYEASADSHKGNTDSFMQSFLTTSAQNRAFSRCVREYLNIHVVGKDEIFSSNDSLTKIIEDHKGSSGVATTPQQILEALANKNKKPLSAGIKWINHNQYMDEDQLKEIKSWGDIPDDICYKMIAYLNKKTKE